MLRKKFQLFFGVLLLAVIGLMFVPAHAEASSKKIPTAFLQTKPLKPQGDDNWYTSVTTVKLYSNREGKVYFQWNGIDGKWHAYNESFRAWRGENTLYFYTVDNRGNKSQIESRVIKVDYTKPEIRQIGAASVNGQAKISWKSDSDATRFKVYKLVDGHFKAITWTANNFYIDKDVVTGQAYIYIIKAADKAGWRSDEKRIALTITQPIVSATSVKPLPKVQSTIGKAAPAASSITSSPSPEKITPTSAPIASGNPVQNQRNWNHLLVAISVLVIAAGAAIGSYFGYEWLARRRENEKKPAEKKTNNRW